MKRLVICWQVIHKGKNIKSKYELLNHRVFFPPGSFPRLNYWNNAQQQTYDIFFLVPHPLCYSKQDLPVFLFAIPIYLGINFLILHPELFSCERFVLQYSTNSTHVIIILLVKFLKSVMSQIHAPVELSQV